MIFLYFLLFIPSFLLIVFLFFLIRGSIKGAPFVPTTNKIVNQMVKVINPKPGWIVCDLGSGDGRIVIAFAKKGIETHGFESNPFLVVWSRYKIYRAKLGDKAFIHWKNFWKENFAAYDVIIIFGISYIMKDLEKKLREELKTSAKVVSVGFRFPKWKEKRKWKGLYLYDVVEEYDNLR